jgi:hypothetical protein
LEDKFPLKIGDFQGLCLFTRGYNSDNGNLPIQVQWFVEVSMIIYSMEVFSHWKAIGKLCARDFMG